MALYCQRAEVACIGSWPHALYLLAPANASDPGCGRLFLPLGHAKPSAVTDACQQPFSEPSLVNGRKPLGFYV